MSRIANPARHRPRRPGEKSDWNETAPYAEAVEISRRLERASRFVKVLDIGATPEGRTMIALVVSKDRAFTPEAAARTGKVIMLIQSGIHAGEIEGKDPALMLVRDMVVGKKYAAWLDRMIFVIIPVFNVDGHEYFSPYHRPSQNGPKSTGLRANAQRMNLNRDYIKADTPEMRAWRRWRSRRISFRADRAPHDGRLPRLASTVRGETGRRTAVRRRHAGALAVVVPAIEIRSRRYRPLPHRPGLGEELVAAQLMTAPSVTAKESPAIGIGRRKRLPHLCM